MMNKLKALKGWIWSHKIASLLILIVIIFIGFKVFGNSDANASTFTITSDNLKVDGITVSGKVVASENVDLGFETSGRISVVYAKEGERVTKGSTIVKLDAGDIFADLQKAQADLAAEIAKLDELRATENGLSKSQSARQEIVQAMREAYTYADDSVHNKVDQFYTDTNFAYPKIIFIFNDNELRNEVDSARRQIEIKTLKEWSALNNTLSADTYTAEDLEKVKGYLSQIRAFVDLVSKAVNKFEANDVYDQSSVDKFRADVATARTNLNLAQSKLLTAEEGLRGTTSEIPYQEARVASMRATVNSYDAKLSKMNIVAPFTGVITKQDAKVGMIASINTPLVSMIGDSEFQVEAFVPEIYTSNLVIGARSEIRLDAYSDDTVFPATLTYIDHAATERDGVATYKVKLTFNTNDERIKSGMTASVLIETEQTTDIIKIPTLGLIEKQGKYYVKVKSGDAVELRSVTIGLRTDDLVEITSGLIIGDSVILAEK